MPKTCLREDYSLKDLNTFGIDVKAKWFIRVSTLDELKKAINSVVFLPKQKTNLRGR